MSYGYLSLIHFKFSDNNRTITQVREEKDEAQHKL